MVGGRLKAVDVGLGQGGGNPPCFRQDGEFDLVRAVFLSVYLQKQARAVKESAFGSQKRAADGQVVGVNGVVNFPLAGLRGGAPPVFFDLGQMDIFSIAKGADGGDVAGEVAYQIAARNPVRQVDFCFQIMFLSEG